MRGARRVLGPYQGVDGVVGAGQQAPGDLGAQETRGAGEEDRPARRARASMRS